MARELHAGSIPSLGDYAKPEREKKCSKVEKRTTQNGIVEAENLVSVITVSFNSVNTIQRTIDSISNQTYSEIEYIVIDGGSTDGTLDIIRTRNSEIDIWLSESDEGISDAFNKGISLASGAYISIVNSDDWLDSHHIDTAVKALKQSGVDFVYGDLALHTADGALAHLFLGERDYQKRISHYMPFLNHPTVMCRRRAFESVGLFDLSYRTAMDYDWFLRFHKMGGVGLYCKELVAHMTLEGRSDRQFTSALREVRDISILHGYPPFAAWARYAYRMVKGTARRQLKELLPEYVYESLRKLLNANYRSKDDAAT